MNTLYFYDEVLAQVLSDAFSAYLDGRSTADGDVLALYKSMEAFGSVPIYNDGSDRFVEYMGK